MKIYRATAPDEFSMQDGELAEFIRSLNLPYESCVVSDCGTGEAEQLFIKNNGMAMYLGGEYIRIPGYRKAYVGISRRLPSRIVYLDDSQTRCVRLYIRPALPHQRDLTDYYDDITRYYNLVGGNCIYNI